MIALPDEGFKVNVFASDWISLCAPKVINPEKVLSPEVDLIAPFEDTPVPLIVIASATVTPPETFKAAPDAIVVAASVVPKEVLLLIAATPADIVVAPV